MKMSHQPKRLPIVSNKQFFEKDFEKSCQVF